VTCKGLSEKLCRDNRRIAVLVKVFRYLVLMLSFISMIYLWLLFQQCNKTVIIRAGQFRKDSIQFDVLLIRFTTALLIC